MTVRLKKTKYEGSIFGIHYTIDFDTDEEFVTWFVSTLKKKNPLLGLILNAVLKESTDFEALKEVAEE